MEPKKGDVEGTTRDNQSKKGFVGGRGTCSSEGRLRT